MSTVWRLGGGSVEEVRSALPVRYRGAYNTVQTVLNRLVDRGLLTRHKRGQAYEYRPTLSEAEYVAGSIFSALAGASMEARRTALAQLIGTLDEVELEELRKRFPELGRRARHS
jgi:predicted transcriptional regulator